MEQSQAPYFPKTIWAYRFFFTWKSWRDFFLYWWSNKGSIWKLTVRNTLAMQTLDLGAWRHSCSLWNCIRISILLSPILEFIFSPSSLGIPTALACLQSGPSPAPLLLHSSPEEWREKSAHIEIVLHRQHGCHVLQPFGCTSFCHCLSSAM